MRKLFCSTGTWLTLAAVLWSLFTQRAEADQRKHPLRVAPAQDLTLLPATGGDSALARDPADGSWLSGGGIEVHRSPCPVVSRAFIERQDENGELRWRRTYGDLLDELRNIDPRYLLASAVRDLAVDPATGDILAAIDVVLGWSEPEAENGDSLSRGIVVLRLDRAGLPLTDVYLGEPPLGAPPREDCGKIGSAAGRQLSATKLQVAPDGGISVLRRQWFPGQAPHEEALLLGSDLTLLGVAAPFKAGACDAGYPNPVSMTTFGGTTIEGGSVALAKVDTCTLSADPDHSSGAAQGFFVEYEFPPPTPLMLTIHIDAQNRFIALPNGGGPGVGGSSLEIALRSSAGNSWHHIGTVAPDAQGHLSKKFPISSPPYLDAQNRILMRVTIKRNSNLKVDDDIDFDCGGID